MLFGILHNVYGINAMKNKSTILLYFLLALIPICCLVSTLLVLEFPKLAPILIVVAWQIAIVFGYLSIKQNEIMKGNCDAEENSN